MVLEETGLVVNVRAPKDQLSGLLEQAANGNENIITSDGLPRARLVPLRSPGALHLASADQAQDWPLVTHDKPMRDAAMLLGFPVAPRPEQTPR